MPKTKDKPKKEKPPKLTPFEREVADMERDCSELDKKIAEAKDHIKTLKEDKAGLVHKIRRTIRGLTEPCPLFDKKPSSEANGKPETKPASGKPDDWRSTSIAALGIAAKTVDALATADITTVGKLADFTAKASTDGLSDWWNRIKGIGKAAAEKVEKAMEKFWQEHPRIDQLCAGDVDDGGPAKRAERDKELQPA